MVKKLAKPVVANGLREFLELLIEVRGLHKQLRSSAMQGEQRRQMEDTANKLDLQVDEWLSLYEEEREKWQDWEEGKPLKPKGSQDYETRSE